MGTLDDLLIVRLIREFLIAPVGEGVGADGQQFDADIIRGPEREIEGFAQVIFNIGHRVAHGRDEFNRVREEFADNAVIRIHRGHHMQQLPCTRREVVGSTKANSHSTPNVGAGEALNATVGGFSDVTMVYLPGVRRRRRAFQPSVVMFISRAVEPIGQPATDSYQPS